MSEARAAARGPGGGGPPLRPSPPETDERAALGRRPLAMLLSLVVAFVLWFSFSMREAYTVTVDVPIRVATLPEGQALARPPPREVQAQVQGEGWTLLGLSSRVPPVLLTAASADLDVVSALRASGLPAGLSVVGAQPRRVALVLDDRVSRRVPVRLVSSLQMAPSHALLRPPVLAPDSVTVMGARSVLATLTHWPTEPLGGDNVREPLARWAMLRDTLDGLVTLDRRQTYVRLDVGEFTEGERMLRVVVRGRPEGAPEVRFEPALVRATYTVPADDTFERAETDAAFVAMVAYADLFADTTSGVVPVVPRVPSGLDVRDVRLSPARVGYFFLRPRVTP